MTTMLLILTAGVSYFCFQQRALFERLKHYPYAAHRTRTYDRLLSAGFVHGSWTHLFVNMFVFYQFGGFVEQVLVASTDPILGRIYFLVSYLVIIVLANIPTLLRHRDDPTFASVGASGGVSGILFMFIMIEPWQMLYLFFIIPCPAIIAGIGYLVYSSWASKNSQDRIDHSAHFYGAVVGIIAFLVILPDIFYHFLNKLTDVPFI